MSEQKAQEAIFSWCEWNHIPAFAIPNGGRRDAREAMALKRAGVKAGVPDMMIPLARHGRHGLFIELKVGKNRPTQKQREWCERLNAEGYLAIVCYGHKMAIDAIKEYVNDG